MKPPVWVSTCPSVTLKNHRSLGKTLLTAWRNLVSHVPANARDHGVQPPGSDARSNMFQEAWGDVPAPSGGNHRTSCTGRLGVTEAATAPGAIPRKTNPLRNPSRAFPARVLSSIAAPLPNFPKQGRLLQSPGNRPR